MLNWAAIGTVLSFMTFLSSVLGVAYLGGRFSQQIADGGKRLDAHDDRLDTHERRIGANDVAIGKLESWKDGYNSAARRLPVNGEVQQ